MSWETIWKAYLVAAAVVCLGAMIFALGVVARTEFHRMDMEDRGCTSLVMERQE